MNTSANASKSRSSLAHSYKYPPDQIVSAISTGNENFTTKEELQEFLENNFQLIMRSFRAKRKLSNIERVKISKGIIQYLLTNPERLLNTKELEHISTLISEVFVGELPSTYYRRYTQGRHASGKLHDAYNNYRTFLAKSGIIQRRTKSRFAASSESEADIDQVSQDANITELTKFMEGAGQLMDNEVVNPQDILESWRHTFSRRRQELKAAKTPELYLKKYPVLLQPKGHQLYLLDAEMLIRKPLSFEVPSAFVSSISGLVKTKHDSVVAILKLIEDEECRIKRTVIAFMLLPYMFPPPIVTSENALVKMTKAECMESFINHYPDIETAEAAVTKLLAKQTEMKPFIVFIGSPIKISWLVMGSTKYSFEDLNSCIKHAMAAYLALNITYPFASQKPWFLLQKYIFKVSLPSDHMLDNKVKTVANDLNLIAR
uniref:Uncharacterized protein n=1 Tax=Stomoxys calcitrans TaxID=35570 RepID=A0A1I8Q575_STOCA